MRWPLKAGVLHGSQVSSQGRMGFIKAQAHQVEGLATPGDGDLHARDKANAVVERRGPGLRQAIQGVVVGERHEAQAIARPRAASSEGGTTPSEAVECICRSTLISWGTILLLSRIPPNRLRRFIMPIHCLGADRPQIHESAYIAPGAQVVGRVALAANTTVWFNAVLRGDNDLLQIGAKTNIQDGAVLHADPDSPSQWVSVSRLATRPWSMAAPSRMRASLESRPSSSTALKLVPTASSGQAHSSRLAV